MKVGKSGKAVTKILPVATLSVMALNFHEPLGVHRPHAGHSFNEVQPVLFPIVQHDIGHLVVQGDIEAQFLQQGDVFDQIFLRGVTDVEAFGIGRESRREFLQNRLLQHIVFARRKNEVFSVDVDRHYVHLFF